MAPGKGRLAGWLGIVGSGLGLLAFIWIRVYYLRSHGQHVFWLAELFSPMALFSVLVVTFVDKMVAPASKVKAHGRKKARS
jgi:hypothetical protein